MVGLGGAALGVLTRGRVWSHRSGSGMRPRRLRVRRAARPLRHGELRRGAVARSLPGDLGPWRPVQRGSRDGKRRLRPGGWFHARPHDRPLPGALRVPGGARRAPLHSPCCSRRPAWGSSPRPAPTRARERPSPGSSGRRTPTAASASTQATPPAPR